MNSHIVLDRNQDFKNVEFSLNNRKIVIDNVDPFEPLQKYIDADKLNELLNMKIEDQKKAEQGMKMNQHITVFDFSRPQTGIGSGKKNFRAYSALTKKKR